MKKWFSLILTFACAAAWAQSPATSPPERLRGTLESFDGKTLVMKERRGDVIRLVVADDFRITEVFPIALSAIQPGSYIGTAATPGPDGVLQAAEVAVFPEAARGSGEGHQPWDLEPGSTMTNATVSDLVVAAQGRTLKLRYKDGEKTLVIPENAPIVSFKSGDLGLLVPGAKIFVTAQIRNAKPTAVSVAAGRDGFGPPM